MRNYILILATSFILTSCASSSTSFSSFYKENKETSSFSISTSSFIANIFIDKKDIQDIEKLFKKIKHYQILIYENNNQQVAKKFDKFIRRNKYNTLFKINDKADKVQLYYLKNQKRSNELVLKIKSNYSSVFMGMRTRILDKNLDKIIENSMAKISSNY